MSFTSKGVSVVEVSKYQGAGVSEKVVITEVSLFKNETYGTTSLKMATLNENGQEGKCKNMSLNIVVGAGKKCSGWDMTARYLKNILMSQGNTEAQADDVLEASDENKLKSNLEKAIIGKPFRGLFSSREYEPGKSAIELYVTEPVGGTKLVWDANNKFYNSKLPTAMSTSAGDSGLPF